MRGERRTRAQALRAGATASAAVGAGVLLRGWARPDASAAALSRAQDVRILRFLLVLEQAQVRLLRRGPAVRA